MSPVIPRSAIPAYSRSRSRSMRAAERFDPIAWRSSSDSAGVNPATSMAICISCSWNSGTPSVLCQRLLEQRVEVGDRLLAVAPPDVRVHRPALDRARPDQRHLDDEVVELARPQPGQRRHLGPRLDLEHADRVGPAQHLVDLGLLRDRRQVDLVAAVLADQVDGVVQRRQHPEAEQVELHQPGRGAVVLVPLQHRAVVHPPPLDRAHLDHRAVADDHPAGVDAEVPRARPRPAGPARSRARECRASGCFAVAATLPHPSTRFDQASCWPGRVAERLGHVAHRRAGPVRDHVGDLGRVVAAVLAVHVLDDLLPPVALDVDVDVRRAVALGRQEALEQQAELDGVGGGDAEGVADGRVGGAPPPLAEDVRLAGRTRRGPTRRGSSRGSRAAR